MVAVHDKMEFRLVFEGEFVDGFTHEQVRQAFMKRFGEGPTVAVFSKARAIIKSGLTREQAEQASEVLAGLGMVITIEEVMPEGYGLTLIDEDEDRQMPGQGRPASAKAANDPDKPGGLAEREPASTSPVNETIDIRDLDRAFTGEVDLPEVSKKYLWRLLPVSALMLLLPMIYVGIALLSLRLTFWVGFSGRSWLFNAVDPGYITLVLYTAVLLACILFTAFLFKPLIADTHAGPSPVAVDPDREPLLYSLVADITEAVGAPMPDEILVDTEVNASARLARGPFSRELILTIGLPLIYGADVRSVVGILAHEFGHFTQAVGMRAQYVVHWVNYWFYRQVHERDSWDAFVDRLFERDVLVLNLAGTLAQFGSFSCRWLLMQLAHVASILSFSFSRQMEFDADRFEIALLGSRQYPKTAERLRILAAARQVALNDLDIALDTGKKVDNLPRLVAMRAASFSDAELDRVRASIDDVNTSVFDTHPTDRERIDRAEAADMEPCFDYEGPATGLVRELERLSKLATLQWYRSYDIEATPDDLLPVESFDSETDNLKRADEANRRYFGELAELPFYLPLPEIGVVARISTEKLVAGLATLKEKLRASKNDIAGKRDRYFVQREYQLYYEQARFWAEAGLPVEPDTYRLRLDTTDPKEIDACIAKHRSSEQRLEADLREAKALLGKRLGVGLELARRSDREVESALPWLRAAWDALAATERDERELEDSYQRLELLIAFCEQAPEKKNYQTRLKSELRRNSEAQDRIREAAANARDPFKPELTLNFLLPDAPAAGSPEPREILESAASMLRQLGRVRFRLGGRMAELALAAEKEHRIL